MIIFLAFALAQAATVETAAAVYDSKTDKFSLVAGHGCVSGASACLRFVDERAATGFSQMLVETLSGTDENIQARAAGYVEAAMTTTQIEQWLLNNDDIYPHTAIPKETRAWLLSNVGFLDKEIKAHAKNNVYWRQVELLLLQMQGMVEGYNAHRAKNATIASIDFMDVFAINAQNSIGDVNTALAVQVEGAAVDGAIEIDGHLLRMPTKFNTKCSALVRFVDDELYLTHDTWSTYNQMLRILKVYKFAFHGVKNERIAFTSYPGTLWSGDDFYSMNDLAVVETTGEVFNVLLWNNITPKCVLTFLRTMLANRLAASCGDWVEIAKQYNSGTYNNAWICVDYSLFRARTNANELLPQTVMMLETLPGFTETGDMSQLISKNKYYASYNIWFFAKTYSMSGNALAAQYFGDWFSFEKCPRANIFRRDAPRTHTLDDVKELVRSNAYLTDPLAVNPVRSAMNAISSRGDLRAPNVSEPFYLTPSCFGGIDAKITNAQLQLNNSFVVVGGPTYGGPDRLAPFVWSQARVCKGVRHDGIQDVQKFDWFLFDTV